MNTIIESYSTNVLTVRSDAHFIYLNCYHGQAANWRFLRLHGWNNQTIDKSGRKTSDKPVVFALSA